MISIAVVIICLTARLSGQKAGYCPPTGPGNAGCLSGYVCNSDNGCDGTQKCCKTTCGDICLEAREQPHVCPSLEGECPEPCRNGYVSSINDGCDTCRCKSDIFPCTGYVCDPGKRCEVRPYPDCAISELPCRPRARCVQETEAQLAKTGSCPTVSKIIGTCLVDCNHDSECPGENKCCFNGCGMSCTVPSSTVNSSEPEDPSPVEKSGACPLPQMMYCFTMLSECEVDRDCSDTLKCCNTGCGMNCMVPVPTCQDITCPQDHQCQLRSVFCSRAPCYLEPVCVPVSVQTISPPNQWPQNNEFNTLCDEYNSRMGVNNAPYNYYLRYNPLCNSQPPQQKTFSNAYRYHYW